MKLLVDDALKEIASTVASSELGLKEGIFPVSGFLPAETSDCVYRVSSLSGFEGVVSPEAREHNNDDHHLLSAFEMHLA